MEADGWIRNSRRPTGCCPKGESNAWKARNTDERLPAEFRRAEAQPQRDAAAGPDRRGDAAPPGASGAEREGCCPEVAPSGYEMTVSQFVQQWTDQAAHDLEAARTLRQAGY